MTLRTVKLICWAAASLCLALAAATIACAVLVPLNVPVTPDAEAQPTKSHAGSGTPVMTMAAFEPLLTGRLCPYLPPPPPPPPPPRPRAVPVAREPAASLNVQLLGTVVEGTDSYAIFQTETGIQVKKRGGCVGGVEIVGISDGAVSIKGEDGNPLMLRVPRPAGE